MHVETREEMVEVGRLLWKRGMVGATEGNISCRLPSGDILCTPTGLSKGHLQPNDLVTIDLEGRPRGGGNPSSEIRLHLRFYRERPDVQSVLHAHPPTATALALVGREIPHGLLPEAVVILGRVRLCPFGMPGTDSLPDSLGVQIQAFDSYLLSNHGAVTVGNGLMDAYWRMETLERVAVVYAKSLALGGPKLLDDHVIDALEAMRAKVHPSVA